MDNLHLTACLALYQHRQDQAIGISWTSEKVRGLLWYYARQQADYLTTAALNVIIQEGDAEIKRLVERAETAEDKRAILQRVLEIRQRVNAAKEQLDG